MVHELVNISHDETSQMKGDVPEPDIPHTMTQTNRIARMLSQETRVPWRIILVDLLHAYIYI